MAKFIPVEAEPGHVIRVNIDQIKYIEPKIAGGTGCEIHFDGQHSISVTEAFQRVAERLEG